MTAYRFHEGRWDRIHSSPINGAQELADPSVRSEYRAGFGLRATSGQLSVDDFEVHARRH